MCRGAIAARGGLGRGTQRILLLEQPPCATRRSSSRMPHVIRHLGVMRFEALVPKLSTRPVAGARPGETARCKRARGVRSSHSIDHSVRLTSAPLCRGPEGECLQTARAKPAACCFVTLAGPARAEAHVVRPPCRSYAADRDNKGLPTLRRPGERVGAGIDRRCCANHARAADHRRIVTNTEATNRHVRALYARQPTTSVVVTDGARHA